MEILTVIIRFSALAAVLTAPAALEAQQAKDLLPAPLPSQITSGRKVFISNAGGDSNGLYSGGPNRLYNQFYAAMKSWGRYELVDNPATADLVFEINFLNPFVGENVSGGGLGHAPVTGRSVNDPQFRLVVLDPGTRVILWVFTGHIESALLQGNRDKNFDQALVYLVNDLRNIAGQPVASSQNTKR